MTKPISERLWVAAVRVQIMAMCSDGIRRDRWAPVLRSGRDHAFRIHRHFHSEEDAKACAEVHRQKCIDDGRMPEYLEAKQRRVRKEIGDDVIDEQ